MIIMICMYIVNFILYIDGRHVYGERSVKSIKG